MSNEDIYAILSADDCLLDPPARECTRSARSCEDKFCNMAPARRCRYGWECRDRMRCSFYHGEMSDLRTQFCDCVELECPKPHPERRHVKRKRLVCNNCGGEHLVTVCPHIKCFKCERYGHFANACGKARRCR
jgi:hypothetical protein